MMKLTSLITLITLSAHVAESGNRLRVVFGKRNRLSCIWLLLFGMLLSQTPSARTVAHHDTPSEGNTSEIKVLFIGNSLTYYNNLGDLVCAIASARRGPKVSPSLVVRGGASLKWHLENGPAISLLQSERWDYVVLQEQSLLGGSVVNGKPVIADPSEFHASVKDWVVRIRAAGAQPVLFMTWARRLDTPEIWQQQEQLAKAYNTIGRELDVPVAPAGLAWAEARRRFISLDLHTWDGIHPSPAGSYLTACVIYSVLTQRSPIGAPTVLAGHPFYETGPDGSDAIVDDRHKVTLVDLPDSLAAELQRVAWEVVSAVNGQSKLQMESIH